jgi:acyl transferase domain-containing protein/7-keto-8-aminopelargonate synthetase-like enzyme
MFMQVVNSMKSTSSNQSQEPLAVIGLACRLPGGLNTPEAFWSLLASGRMAIREVSQTTRHWSWPDAAEVPPYAALLDQVDQFDAPFFHISPKEATALDPQQRLLLETSWEALEQAGINPASLRGSDTGIFVGIFLNDYQLLQIKQNAAPHLYGSTGTSAATASGRLSYFLGLQGPAVSIDTASSSSLVAFHLACQSLWNGECQMALASGVNLILAPDLTIAFSQAGMLSPNGRSTGFDVAANGYVRGEGCGVVVLKRLSAAQRDGDNVLAVVRGTAINQDGASQGLTVPSGPSQEAVIRKALAAAGVQPEEVTYVEAHGSGTPVGDPIEGRALQAVYGEGRKSPWFLGSVKSNIGHLEAAAGIAGVIKTVLALQNRHIPAHLHYTQLNPQLADLQAIIPTEGQAWPAENGEPRRAGVSSFGFSGTNAHAILEESPHDEAPRAAPTTEAASHHLVALSARSQQSLRTLAESYVEYLAAHPEVAIADISHTLLRGRADFECRLAVVAESTADLASQLRAFLSDASAPGLVAGTASTSPRPKVAFLFTGLGSQYVDMGRDLFSAYPVFREALVACDEILRPWLERPLLEVMYPSQGAISPLDEMRYMQPAIFGVEYALAKLWQSWGIEPDVVLGHSFGEYVAACIAGVFSLEDGLKLIARRGELMDKTAVGEMFALEADESEVASVVADFAEEASVGVVNGTLNTVVSGSAEAIQAILARLAHVKATRLNVTRASHSPLMDSIMEQFAAVAAQVAFTPPKIPLVSNRLASIADDRITHPEYWSRHLRDTVRFGDGIEVLHQQGVQIFVEIGAKPILLSVSRNHLSALARRPGSSVDEETLASLSWLPSLRPNIANHRTILESLAELYARGLTVVKAEIARGEHRRLVLPTYPFDRQRYWLDAAARQATVEAHRATSGSSSFPSSPRAKQRLAVANDPAIRFSFDLSQSLFPYLGEHRFFGRALLSAGVFFEFALTSGRDIFNSSRLCLENVALQQPLQLPEDPAALRTIQLVLSPDETGAIAFQTYSFAEGSAEAAWISHASGRLRALIATEPEQLPDLPKNQIDIATLHQRCPEELPVAAFYALARAWQLSYRQVEDGQRDGLDYQVLTRLSVGAGAAIGEVHLPTVLHTEAEGFALHPLLIEGGIQVAQATFASATLNQNETYLPVGLDRLRLFRPVIGDVWAYARLETQTTDLIKSEVLLLDEEGLVAYLEGLTFQRTTRQALLRPSVTLASSAGPATPVKLMDQLVQVSDSQRQALLQEYVKNQVRRVLGLRPSESLSNDSSLKDLGLDSLISANLRSSFERDLKVMLPMDRLLQSDSTVTNLTRLLLKKIAPSAKTTTAHTNSSTLAVHPHDKVAATDDFNDSATDIPQIHAVVTAQEGRKVKVDDRWVFDFASCNYLGLDLHPEVMESIMPAIHKWGVHPSWTRAVASPGIYEELEQSLADLMGVYSTLVFPAVTLLHAGVIPILAGSDGVIFKDLSAHRSIDEASRLAQTEGAEVIVFKHNDPRDLEQRLAQYPLERTKLIVIDGVYSMSGVYPPLPEFARLAKQYNATVYMDDAHGMGVIGERPSTTKPYGYKGNGIVNHFGLEYESDRLVYVAGLSKSYSSFGAFITCTDQATKNRFRSASTFIFSGPSPTASLASALAGIHLNQREGETWRDQIYFLTHRLITGAKAMGYEVINDNYFPIVCVVIGKTREVIKACQTLWDYGILITPALYPIVPKERGLLRFSITAANTVEEIDRSLAALAAVRERFS